MDLVSLTIDGVQVQVPAGTTVLEAARLANIQIPTLCYLKDVNQIGACRMCLVDTGARAFAAACVMPVSPNMVVKTNTPAIREARKVNMELLLSNHDRKCLTCVRSRNCELQTLAEELGVRDVRFEGKRNEYPIDDSSPSVVRDPNKCIQCRRCIAACGNVQKIGVIGTVGRGFNTLIAGRGRLRQLRPVHHGLPGRRPAREGQHRGSLGRHRRSEQARGRAARPGRARGAGRGVRHAHGHARYRQARRGPSPHGL